MYKISLIARCKCWQLWYSGEKHLSRAFWFSSLCCKLSSQNKTLLEDLFFFFPPVDSPTTPIRTGSVGSIGQVGTTARMVHRKIQDAKQGKLYVAVKDYSAQEYGELTLRKGDYVKGQSVFLHDIL